MTDGLENDRVRLSQAKFLDWVKQDFPPTTLLPVWWKIERPETSFRVFCALIPNEKVKEVLADPTWDLSIGHGMPDAIKHGGGGKEPEIEYDRFGGSCGIEPLIFCREFHGLRPGYEEVNEEFRLFHNLYHDRPSDTYIKFDDAGNETTVAEVTESRISIRLHEIRQFSAAKDMHLALFFDNREHSKRTLDELGVRASGDDIRDESVIHGLSYGTSHGLDDWESFSRLLGKRLFAAYPKHKSGLWAYRESETPEPVQFIIKVNAEGDEILGSAHSHGGRVEYLTPVFFRRAVLDKYYHQPNKYSVGDSYFGCGHLWGMPMDNHHDDYVVAWLGDLGRDLPHEEQLHWRGQNIPPCGQMSDVFFRRQLQCEPAESKQPDLVFKQVFPEFCAKSQKRLGWSVFLPLADADRHCFSALRIPASNEHKEFDELVGALTKVLVDSLNEAELNKLLDPPQAKALRGSIARLEAVFERQNAAGYKDHIQFLRDLQNLRSTGSAHRKGTEYKKVAERFKIGAVRLPQVFKGILAKCLTLLEYLEGLVSAGTFDQQRSPTNSP